MDVLHFTQSGLEKYAIAIRSFIVRTCRRIAQTDQRSLGCARLHKMARVDGVLHFRRTYLKLSLVHKVTEQSLEESAHVLLNQARESPVLCRHLQPCDAK